MLTMAVLGIDTTAEIASTTVIVVILLSAGVRSAWKRMTDLATEKSDQTPGP